MDSHLDDPANTPDDLARTINATWAGMAANPDVPAMWQRLAERAELSPRRHVHPPIVSNPGRRERLSRQWPIVGVAVAFVLLTIAWASRSGVLGRPAQTIRAFASMAGSRATITLRDGTRVTLGPESQLRIAADFDRGTRTVVLDGEAYFSVVHDAAHPFVVHTSGLTVMDVGTEFDIRAYVGDANVRVAVTKGEVCLERATAPVCRPSPASSLHAGDVATVSDAQFTVAHNTDIDDATAWLQGRLVFNNTPLLEVARQLSRVFGMLVTVPDSALAVQHFTGAYDQESVEQVLNDIMESSGARYERKGRTVVIRRGTGNAINPRRPSPHPLTTAEVSSHAH